MPTIHGTATDGTNPVAGAEISAVLVASVLSNPPGFIGTLESEIVRPVATTTIKTGYWELVLVENALIAPAGSVWRITERPPGGRQTAYYVVVGAVDAWVGDLVQVDPNESLPPRLAGDVVGPATATQVVAIRGTAVSPTAPEDGQALVYVAERERYEPSDAGSGGAGDATSIRGVEVTEIGPTFGQLLVYDAATTKYLLRNVGGWVDVRDIPDGNGNVAEFDGTTHDGLAVAAAFLWAHAHNLRLTMPIAGDTVMLDPDGNPVLIQLDFHDHPWTLEVEGLSRYATTLQYPVDLGLVTDPTDLTLAGDPSGRVSQFAIDGLYQNQGNNAYRLHDFGMRGSFATQPEDDDPQSRARGWAARMGGRAHAERLSIENFHAALVYRPRIGSAHADKQIDHNNAIGCDVGTGCAYGYYWNYYSPRTGLTPGDGDHVIAGPNSGASQASVAGLAWSPDAVAFDSLFQSVHKGAAPYGRYRESGPKGDKTIVSGTAARDAAGIVTVVTNDPGGPSTIWPGDVYGPAFGFLEGDVVDLAGLGLTLASDDLQAGRVETVSSDGTGTLTFLMEAPIVGSAISATDISEQSIAHHYNLNRWLDSNVEFDGSDEGCGTSFIRCADGDSTGEGYDDTTTFVFHGNEVIDRQHGNQQALSPVPVQRATRVNLTNPNHTGVDHDVMQVTLELPTGTPLALDACIFYNSPISGPWQDDLPPQTGWNPDVDRMRGKFRLASVDDDGTVCTVTYLQLCRASRGHLYTEKILGDGTTGSAGGLGRVAAVVIGDWIGMSPTINILHEGQSGTAPTETEMLLGGELRRSHTKLSGRNNPATVLNVRSLPGTTDAGSNEPVRSLLELGSLKAEVAHNVEPTGGPTSGWILPGHALELSGRADVRLYRGGQYAGMALFRRFTNDYVPYMTEGQVRGSEYGIDFPQDPDDTVNNHGGALLLTPCARGDILAPDPTNPGLWRIAQGGDPEILYATGAATGPRTVGTLENAYIAAVKTLKLNGVAPVVAPSNILQSLPAGQTATATDAGATTVTFDDLFQAPTVGELLVLIVAEQIKAGTSSQVGAVSGCGATWTQLYRHTLAAMALEVWVGVVGGTPSAGPVTFTTSHSHRSASAQLLYVANCSAVHNHSEADDGGTPSAVSSVTWTPTVTDGVDVAIHAAFKGQDATVFDAASQPIRLNTDFGVTGNVLRVCTLEEPRSVSGTPIAATAEWAGGSPPDWISGGLTFTYGGPAAPVDTIDGGLES